MIAKAAKKTLSGSGARVRNRESTPRLNAMSVAIGMPQPLDASPPELNAKYMSAGTIIPPNAAKMGRAARLTERSSPTMTARFISRPTTKKKTAIRPSSTQ